MTDEAHNEIEAEPDIDHVAHLATELRAHVENAWSVEQQRDIVEMARTLEKLIKDAAQRP